MKLGVCAVMFGDKTLAEAAKVCRELGLGAMELGCGGYPGKAHVKPEELLGSPAKVAELKKTVEGEGLVISALSCHGNPVHPQKAIADSFHNDFVNAVKLAEQLGVERVVTFSGCPGDAPGAKYPNWVTCPWPDDFLDILKYQWDEVLIPYWREQAKFVEDHGVKVALEMHPGFAVYNPETCLKLRAATSSAIGANFDPSHLFWQGIDIVAAIRAMGPAIHYFHAKDTKVDPLNSGVNGVLDTKHYGDEIHRSWLFRAVGYGHSEAEWKDIVSNLRMVGYDWVMSIEHEDSLMTSMEGLKKAIDVLKAAVMFQAKGGMFWA